MFLPDRATMSCAISGAVALLFAICLFDESVVLQSAVLYSGEFKHEYLKASYYIDSMLVSEAVCRIIADDGRALSLVSRLLTVTLSAVIGCLIAPFITAFPPVVVFLLRILCPEALCYPRPYRRAVRVIDAYELLSVIRATLCFLVVASGLALNVKMSGMNGVMNCFVLGCLVIVTVYVFRIRGSCGDVPLLRRAASGLFHCSLMTTCLALVLMLPFSSIADFW